MRLGIAVDVQKKDGSRTLLVPNIKGAQKLGFAEFLSAFDELVARSRKGQISPDDFKPFLHVELVKAETDHPTLRRPLTNLLDELSNRRKIGKRLRMALP